MLHLKLTECVTDYLQNYLLNLNLIPSQYSILKILLVKDTRSSRTGNIMKKQNLKIEMNTKQYCIIPCQNRIRQAQNRLDLELAVTKQNSSPLHKSGYRHFFQDQEQKREKSIISQDDYCKTSLYPPIMRQRATRLIQHNMLHSLKSTTVLLYKTYRIANRYITYDHH